jgi:hypothetical protein
MTDTLTGKEDDTLLSRLIFNVVSDIEKEFEGGYPL